MATRLRRGRASGKPTRAQYNRATPAEKRAYAQLTKAAGLSGGRSSGS